MYSKEEVDEFHKKSFEGNLDTVKNALSKHPSLINEKDEGFWGKLIWLFIETFPILTLFDNSILYLT